MDRFGGIGARGLFDGRSGQMGKNRQLLTNRLADETIDDSRALIDELLTAHPDIAARDLLPHPGKPGCAPKSNRARSVAFGRTPARPLKITCRCSAYRFPGHPPIYVLTSLSSIWDHQ